MQVSYEGWFLGLNETPNVKMQGEKYITLTISPLMCQTPKQSLCIDLFFLAIIGWDGPYHSHFLDKEIKAEGS